MNFTTASGPLAEALNLDSGAEIVEIPFGSLGETALYRIYVTLASAHIHIERQMAAKYDNSPRAWIWTTRAGMTNDDNDVTLNILTSARSIEHARHIATELRARLIVMLQTVKPSADQNNDVTAELLKILEDAPSPATS